MWEWQSLLEVFESHFRRVAATYDLKKNMICNMSSENYENISPIVSVFHTSITETQYLFHYNFIWCCISNTQKFLLICISQAM
jgi:hypothetical protein